MSEMLTTLGMVAGGLGLFLLAVTMITEGFKLAAGDALSDILKAGTRTPGRGIVSGIAITGLVQSSSAVTVATIGFVNAGLLSMAHALGVIYGANVGTTMTGWLVAAIGFKFKIELFALPLIGIGMLLRLTGARKRRGALGWALVGFGLFFIGIDVLKTAFEGMAATTDVSAYTAQGVWGMIMFIGIGFVMTVLTQSSSAAIAIILTAATGGVIALPEAAAMVIGANIGTTSTAALAVIGATPSAKRVAAAHIIFNVVTASVALVLMPLMLWLVARTSHILGMDDIPAVSLALFHTVFNVLGVLLMWPLTQRLARFLEGCFRSAEEIEGKPRYLDKTVIASPELAFNALYLELGHVSEVTRRIALGALSSELAPSDKMLSDKAAIQSLINHIEHFIGQLGSSELPDKVSQALAKVLRTTQYLGTVADLADFVATAQSRIHELSEPALMEAIAAYRAQVVELISLSDVQDKHYDAEVFAKHREQVDNAYHELKDRLLVAGAHQRIKIRDMTFTNEQLSRIHRLVEQLAKSVNVMQYLLSLSSVAQAEPEVVTPPVETAAVEVVETTAVTDSAKT